MESKWIRKRILTVFAVAFAGLLAVSIVCVHVILRQNIQREVDARINSFQELFQTGLDEDSALFRSILDSIGAQPALQKAWLARDREALFREASSSFEEMDSLYNVSHLYFVDLDKICFLRMHQKERYGDIIERELLSDAVREGKSTSGAELDSGGTFTLRVVQPWWIEGRLAGYVEIGLPLSHVMSEIKGITDADLIFFIRKSLVDRTRWENRTERLERVSGWNQFPDHVVVEGTISEVPFSVTKALVQHEFSKDGESQFEILAGDREYMCGFVPLLDAGRRQVGEAVVMSDVTGARAAAQRFVRIVAGAFVCVGVVLFGFLTFYIGRIEKVLVENDKSLRSEIERRRRTEEAIAQTAQEWQTTFDSSNDVIWVLDRNRLVQRSNKAAEKLFDRPNEELIGKHCWEIVHGTERPIPDCPLFRVEKSLHRERMDLQIGDRWFTITADPILDAAGGFSGAVHMIRDITDLKQSRAKLMRLSAAIEQAAETVVITDAAGTIEYVNPAFEKITGYGSKEAIGQNCRILKSGEQDAVFYKKLWNTLLRGETWSGRFINKKKDGTLYTEEATISPVKDAAGKIVNYVAVKRDVTGEIKLEEQIRQSQKMQAIGQLVGGVAHDFNNLLQVINGYTQIAQTKMDPNHVAIASLEEIAKAGESAKDLVRQLLAFSRQQVIDPVDLDLNGEIESSQKMLARLIGEHIHVEFIAGKGLGPVFADKGQISQVLMNLCANARDAMPAGGTLTIETEDILIAPEDTNAYGLARSGRYVLLSVSDTGCGMDKTTCDKIFDPFFTTKEAGKGTGLGLSTVYGIVKQNEGHITVYSEVGKGSVFKIYLPVSSPRPAGAISSISENAAFPAGGIETILVAEDDEMNLELAAQLLSGEGYTILTAKDGEEAVRVFEEHADEIDLVMMDVVMPRMGGNEAMEKMLKKRPALRHLFVSGYSPDAGHNDFIKEKGGHLLNKPYQVDTLLRKIRDVLDENQKTGA